MSYVTTVGLEVHAELKTQSKMFCGCKNDPHDSNPNTHICPVCTGQPGTLPTPNQSAIEKVLLFGLAVGAKPAVYSEFDRKNYFYPDIPKAYQISQYAHPFLTGGSINDIALTRVHLEEDTARSQHDKGNQSLVDFNRAGVPLMELVTEPVIHDAKTAGTFARELQLLLRTLNISDANMEKGEMRVEANISVSQTSELGVKVEVKNLNSFKSVEAAIEYEVSRQIELLEAGKIVSQETRGWDENKARTFTQRTKETAKDYRYFPDPDLPKLDLAQCAEFSTTRLSEKLPKLPNEKRLYLKNLGITRDLAEVILSDRELDVFFTTFLSLHDGVVDALIVKLATNYLTSDLSALRAAGKYQLEDLSPQYFSELMFMLSEGKINSRVAKDLLPELFSATEGPLAIAKKRGLLQVSDLSALAPMIDEILAENPAVVAEYKAGKESVIQFLVGQGMKKSQGAAHPGTLKDLLIKALE